MSKCMSAAGEEPPGMRSDDSCANGSANTDSHPEAVADTSHEVCGPSFASHRATVTSAEPEDTRTENDGARHAAMSSPLSSQHVRLLSSGETPSLSKHSLGSNRSPVGHHSLPTGQHGASVYDSIQLIPVLSQDNGRPSPPLTASEPRSSGYGDTEIVIAQAQVPSTEQLVQGLKSLSRKDLFEVLGKVLPIDVLAKYLGDHLDTRTCFAVFSRVLSVDLLTDFLRDHLDEEDLFQALRKVLSTRVLLWIVGCCSRQERIEVLQGTTEQLGMDMGVKGIEKIKNKTAVALQAYDDDEVNPTKPMQGYYFKAGDIIRFTQQDPTLDPKARFGDNDTTPSPEGLMTHKHRPLVIRSIDRTTNQVEGYKLSTHDGSGMGRVHSEGRRYWYRFMLPVGLNGNEARSRLNETGRPALWVENVPTSMPWTKQSHIDTLSPASFRFTDEPYVLMGQLTKQSLQTLLEDAVVDHVNYARHVVEHNLGGRLNISISKTGEIKSESSDAPKLTATTTVAKAKDSRLDTRSEVMSGVTGTDLREFKSDAGSNFVFSAADTSANIPANGVTSSRTRSGKHKLKPTTVDPSMAIFDPPTQDDRKRRGSATSAQSPLPAKKIRSTNSSTVLGPSITSSDQRGSSSLANSNGTGSGSRPTHRKK